MSRRSPLVRRAFLLSADNLSQRVASGASYQILGVASRIVVTIGSVAVLARLLSPSDFGLVAMATVVTEFAALFANVGLTSVLVQRRRINRLQLDTVFWASVGIGLLLTLGVAAAASFSRYLFADDRIGSLLIALSPSFLLSSLYAIPTVVLTRLLRFRTEFGLQIATAATRALTSIAFAWAGFGVWSLVAGALTGSLMQAVLALVLVPFWSAASIQLVRISNRPGVAAQATSETGYVHYANTNFDVLVIGRGLGATSLGYYQNARTLTDEVRGRLAVPLQRVLFPAFSTLQGDTDKLRYFVRRGTTMLAAIVIPISFGISANAAELVSVLYGQKWLPMTFILQMFGLSAGFRAVAAVSTSLFHACDRVGLSLRYNVVGTIIMIVTVVLAVPYGVNAVAAAMAAASLYWLITFRIGISLVGLRTKDALVILGPATAASAAMWLSIAAARGSMHEWLGTNWVLLPQVLVGAVVYVVLLSVLAPTCVRDYLMLMQRALGRSAPRH